MQFLFNILPWICLSDFRLDPRTSGLAFISLESSHHCTQTSYIISSPDTFQIFFICSQVVHNYCSSVVSLAQFYGWDTASASHPAVIRFLRAILINSHFRPTPGEYLISKQCMTFQELVITFMTPLYSGQFSVGFLCLC